MKTISRRRFIRAAMSALAVLPVVNVLKASSAQAEADGLLVVDQNGNATLKGVQVVVDQDSNATVK